MSDLPVKFRADSGGEIELSSEVVKKKLCATATDQEISLFIELCKYQRLNPFLREVYLIKYGTSPATMVTGKELFTKRAESHPQYDGFEAGIVLVNEDGELKKREGSLLRKGEELLGGWAKVFRKDKEHPVLAEVSMQEYSGKKQDGSPTRPWAEKPATMIRKVALVQALREAFPNTFGGLYSEEEINTVDTDRLPREPVKDVTPHFEAPRAVQDATPNLTPTQTPPVSTDASGTSVQPQEGDLFPVGPHKRGCDCKNCVAERIRLRNRNE